jgi:hypothetical protein
LMMLGINPGGESFFFFMIPRSRRGVSAVFHDFCRSLVCCSVLCSNVCQLVFMRTRAKHLFN